VGVRMVVSSPPQFMSRAVIADTLLDASPYDRLHQIIYIIHTLLYRTNASTRWSSEFESKRSTRRFLVHQFCEKRKSQNRSHTEKGTAVRFVCVEKYRWRIVFGQLVLVLYHFCPKSAPTSSCFGVASVLKSDGN